MFWIYLVSAHELLCLIISQSTNSDIFHYQLTPFKTLRKIFSVFPGIRTEPFYNVEFKTSKIWIYNTLQCFITYNFCFVPNYVTTLTFLPYISVRFQHSWSNYFSNVNFYLLGQSWNKLLIVF